MCPKCVQPSRPDPPLRRAPLLRGRPRASNPNRRPGRRSPAPSPIRPVVLLALLVLLLAPGPDGSAQGGADAANAVPATVPADLAVRPAPSPIAVDGLLSEAAWEEARAIPLSWEWYPGDNVASPVPTECLVTFDDDHLYVAFRAADPDPAAIRAHLADRDSAFADDLVGFVLDPFADGRRGYRFQVNALGVQMDARVDDVEGDTDWSWDAIWNAAGRLTPDGYVVEIAVPWKQLRFPGNGAGGGAGGGERTWGFLALRDYPRSVVHQLRSSPNDRERDCFVCQLHGVTGLRGLTPGANVELVPTVTAARTDRRGESGGGLEDGDEEAEAGLTARWGITPGVGLSATLNPDFSQVEADAAVLDVNERFALFFPERRPFFLEGADLFSSLLPAVFTRTIADPAWGTKLAGKAGRHGFGVLLARDEVNNLVFPGYQGSGSASLDQEVDNAVVRYRRDVGARSSLGFLYTGRDAAGGDYRNQVLGVDGALRLTPSDTVRFQVLGSRTRYPVAVAEDEGQPDGAFRDAAVRLQYSHGTRDWSWFANYDDLGEDFRADSGFVTRVGYRRGQVGVERAFWGEEGGWYRRLELFAGADATESRDGAITEWGADVGVVWQGAGQTVASFFLAPNEEHFAGVDYDNFRYSASVSTRPRSGLGFGLGINWGDTIDFRNARQASFVRVAPEVEFNLGRHVEGELEHSWQDFQVAAGDLFESQVSELRLLYHFDRRTYLRAIVQRQAVDFNGAVYRDAVPDETEDLFLQLLLSYKLNPRTALLAGYSDERQGDPLQPLVRTGRAFFLKVGYAVLF